VPPSDSSFLNFGEKTMDGKSLRSVNFSSGNPCYIFLTAVAHSHISLSPTYWQYARFTALILGQAEPVTDTSMNSITGLLSLLSVSLTVTKLLRLLRCLQRLPGTKRYQFVSKCRSSAKNQSVTSHLNCPIQASLPLLAYSMNGQQHRC